MRVYYPFLVSFIPCFAQRRDRRRDNNSNHGYTIIARIFFRAIMVIQLLFILCVYYPFLVSFIPCFAQRKDTRRDNNSNHGYTIIAVIIPCKRRDTTWYPLFCKEGIIKIGIPKKGILNAQDNKSAIMGTCYPFER